MTRAHHTPAPLVLTLLALAATAGLLGAGRGDALAAARPQPPAAQLALQQEQPPKKQVDDHAGTRVRVQLAVLGAALFVVVGVGLAGFIVRRRLGLVAPPPPSDSEAHH